EEPHQLKVSVGEPFAGLARQPVCQFSNDLFSIGSPVLTAQLLLDDAPADLKIGVDLDQVHAAGHSGARPGDQFADAVEKRYIGLHNSPRTVSSLAALSASSAAISSMISSGLRWTTASPPLGFFTERSKVAGSMVFASTVQDFGESANVACNSNELGKVGVVQRVGLAEIAAGVELVIPD